MKTLLVVLLGAIGLSSAMWGGDIAVPECHMHATATPTVAPKAAMPQVMTGDQFALGLLKSIGPKSLFVPPVLVADARVVNTACPHGQAFRQWPGWRRRNPNVQSQYVKGPQQGKPNPSDPEPNLLQPCGCDPATALAMGGCGWWHMVLGG